MRLYVYALILAVVSAFVLGFLLAAQAEAAPDVPVAPGPNPDQADYVVNVFAAKHISANGDLRYMVEAHLWLMDRTADTVQHFDMDLHGDLRVNMYIGHDYWWAIYPAREYANEYGRCRIVERNAGQIVPAEIPIRTQVTFYHDCDSGGLE